MAQHWTRLDDGASDDGSAAPGSGRRPVRCARDISYHTARSIEELDRARDAVDRQARRAHEHMAHLHLEAASRLYRDELCRIVADRVD